jgi:hypothetical protein
VGGTGLGGPFCNKHTFGSFKYKENDNQSLIGIQEFWGLKEGKEEFRDLGVGRRCGIGDDLQKECHYMPRAPHF